MNFEIKKVSLLFLILVISIGRLFAQPANNTCATATTLSVGSNCSTTAGTLFAATLTNPTGSCGNRRDVWYRFTVPSSTNTISISVNLNVPGNLTTGNTFIELFNARDCGTLNNNAIGVCSTIVAARVYAGLTPGDVYYFRVNTTVTPTSPASFNVCVTVPPRQMSRMNEVFKDTVLSPATALNYPWEIAYGPDNYLWVTESRGYKVSRINPNTGARTTVLDISQGASGYLTGTEHTAFNAQFPLTQNPWPQGGLAGLALHPKFMDAVTPQNYVYISYVHTYNGGSSPNGIFFTNRLVRFTYNTSLNKLESPVSLCDTLPGGNDHNSQRIIIAPVTVGGPSYLFYAQGDVGAGQFSNRLRAMRAQNPSSYEGKILRFNLVSDGDPGLGAWIPNDNPYSSTSAVWNIGMRNNQGFAYDTALNILYGAAHGAYSDDEINIIQPFKNYGHPLVIGYADGNYNGNVNPGTNTSISAGAPWTDNSGNSTCPPIGNETTRMNEINAAAGTAGPYKGPLFSAYATPAATIANTWLTNPGNANWLSEGWSGLDIYQNKVIPGWNKSLVAAGLKWGRLIRLPLSTTGTTTLPSNLDSANTADTITYFQSTNRYRDLAFAPNGKDIFLVMDNSSATSGPGVGNPTVPACPGCVIKYTFLGYADQAGLSSIPKTIPVTDGAANTCNEGTQITIDASNNFLWVPITGPDGNIMVEINAMGQNLGLVTSSFYKNSGAIRVKVGYRYLDRNITISPTVTSFATPVKLRLYISKAEYDALAADPLSGITNINQIRVLKNNDPCSSLMSPGSVIMLTPSNTLPADLAHGTSGYVFQVDVAGFSSFYFGSGNTALPLNLITFTGSLQNKTTTVLNWKTTNEINSSYFIVERSVEGQHFNALGRVEAAAIASTENNYAYNDGEVASLQAAAVFYRLKMFDKSGTYRYSKIIKITLPQVQNEVTVSPNPVSSDVHANVTAVESCNADWQIIDMAGRVLLQNSTVLQKGNSSLDINISQLPAASYYLTIKGVCFDLKTKFQKF